MMHNCCYPLYLLMVSILLVGCRAQPANTAIRLPDPEGEFDMLVGTAAFDSLQTQPYASWYDAQLETYEPDTETVAQLEGLLSDVRITVFMGTWCSDSKREVPRFVKILETVGYDPEDVEVIAMTRDKTTPQGYEKGMSIINIPTFIFSKEEKELGRIVEYPIEDLESDMLKILSGGPYRHAYDWD
jgi:thiol-disulfide isomerase/thioredoxin